MVHTIRTKDELEAAFVAGWSLWPSKLSSRWILQRGKPGYGSALHHVSGSAANAVIKMDNVKRVGSEANPYYIRTTPLSTNRNP